MSDPLANKLAEILVREQITQEQMAHRIGVSTGYLSMVLAGKRGVGRKLLDGAGAAFPELLAAHAASLTIRAELTATTPHEATDATRDLNASDDRHVSGHGATADSEPAVPGMPEAAPTLEATVSRDAGDPLPVL
jgi:transcriptional regulator with XRE-family HTH domain